MKSTLILGIALAASVVANPIRKRDEVAPDGAVFETVYVTVTQDSAPPAQETASVTAPPPSEPTQDIHNNQQDQPQPDPPSQPQPPSQGSGSPPTANPVSSDYIQGILDVHNNHRLNHSAPPLTWSNELASIAQQIGQSCVYAHDQNAGGGGYGQNIGAGAPTDQVSALISNNMYNDEIGFYPGYNSEPDMSDFHHWGHFSQIVWKETQEVGCATVNCPGGLANTGEGVNPDFTVCNYRPVGNVAGAYAANVQPPLGMAVEYIGEQGR